MRSDIRHATPGDFDSLVALFRQSEQIHANQRPDIFAIASPDDVTKTFQKFLSEDSTVNLVLESDGKLRGYLRYRIASFPNTSFLVRKGERRCYLEEIVIDQSARRLGLGRTMLLHLEKLMKNEGVKFIHLHVFDFNASAAAFYASLGFQPITKELGKTI